MSGLVKHLPLWFPGAGFKRKAIEWRKKMEEFVDRPYDHVRQRMVRSFPKVGMFHDAESVYFESATALRYPAS